MSFLPHLPQFESFAEASLMAAALTVMFIGEVLPLSFFLIPPPKGEGGRAKRGRVGLCEWRNPTRLLAFARSHPPRFAGRDEDQKFTLSPPLSTRISRASSGVAISRPKPSMIWRAFVTCAAFDSASLPGP